VIGAEACRFVCVYGAAVIGAFCRVESVHGATVIGAEVFRFESVHGATVIGVDACRFESVHGTTLFRADCMFKCIHFTTVCSNYCKHIEILGQFYILDVT
jgi:hypothetical protein